MWDWLKIGNGVEDTKSNSSRVSIAVLAAGHSSRMANGRNKLLARIDGVTLIRRAAITALDTGLDVTVILGHQAGLLQAQLRDLPVTLVHNASSASGMASSLRLAVEHAAEAAGLLVHLADMPLVGSDHLRAVVDTFEAHQCQAIVRGTAEGRAGHPVILPRALFPAIAELSGDKGARPVIEQSRLPILGVELCEAAEFDVDTAEAMAKVNGAWD